MSTKIIETYTCMKCFRLLKMFSHKTEMMTIGTYPALSSIPTYFPSHRIDHK